MMAGLRQTATDGINGAGFEGIGLKRALQGNVRDL